MKSGDCQLRSESFTAHGLRAWALLLRLSCRENLSPISIFSGPCHYRQIMNPHLNIPRVRMIKVDDKVVRIPDKNPNKKSGWIFTYSTCRKIC